MACSALSRLCTWEELRNIISFALRRCQSIAPPATLKSYMYNNPTILFSSYVLPLPAPSKASWIVDWRLLRESDDRAEASHIRIYELECQRNVIRTRSKLSKISLEKI